LGKQGVGIFARPSCQRVGGCAFIYRRVRVVKDKRLHGCCCKITPRAPFFGAVGFEWEFFGHG
jgi:hypothetical protein